MLLSSYPFGVVSFNIRQTPPFATEFDLLGDYAMRGSLFWTGKRTLEGEASDKPNAGEPPRG